MVSVPIIDVLIVGGSHAGLSAALTLYRALHTCVIFDTNAPRNSYSTAVHLTPGMENKDADKMREECRDELKKSGLITFVDQGVVKVEKTSGGLFQATDSQGTLWLGRKLLLAYGTEEIFPDLAGYAENYSTGM